MVKWFSGVLFLVVSLCAVAQNKDAECAKWHIESKEISKDVYELTFTADIEKSYHMYSQRLYDTSLIGPVSMEFVFKKKSGCSFLGKTVSKTKEITYYDKGFEQNVYWFENKAVFVQKVRVTKPISSISGSIEYQICRTSCYLKKKKFTVPLKKGINNAKGLVDILQVPVLHFNRLLNPGNIC